MFFHILQIDANQQKLESANFCITVPTLEKSHPLELTVCEGYEEVTMISITKSLLVRQGIIPKNTTLCLLDDVANY